MCVVVAALAEKILDLGSINVLIASCPVVFPAFVSPPELRIRCFFPTSLRRKSENSQQLLKNVNGSMLQRNMKTLNVFMLYLRY